MKVRRILTTSLLAVTTFCLPALPAFAFQQPEVSAHPQTDASDKVYPMDQIVTATVHDAWLLSGQDEEKFFDIVQQLAEFSAQKRGVTLPDTSAAGRRMGTMIKTRAKADHDQLLYTIVDQAVRTLSGKSSASVTKSSVSRSATTPAR